jgi:4-hydroxy-4-methyl-2-oxoglutarate aldolase
VKNNKDYGDRIIEIIKEFGLTTTEIADALGKTGVIPLCHPILSNYKKIKIGYVRTLFSANGSNWEVHNDISSIKESEIPVIFTENCDNRAIIGELMAKYMIKKKKANAVVVHGLVRDAQQLTDSNIPIWCMGVTPIGCVNTTSALFPIEKRNDLEEKYNGGVAICDATGVIVIQKKYFTKSMVNNLIQIKDQEKVWFYCMNKLGWDTKKIVCDKMYLSDNFSIPEELDLSLKRLKDYDNQ